MTPAKRVMDVLLVLVLSVLLVPVLLVLVLACLIVQGRPIFYLSERMRGPDDPFQLIKLRTMTVAAADRGVSGGDKAARITRLGHLLRRSRADEIPQLWNILRGDISFVGPRPPLREYVERFPDLYARVLRSRPGVTGMATLYFHAHEDWLLARCLTAEETDATYARACVPRKAHLDLIYQKRRTVCLDLWLIWQTAKGVFVRRK